jgi:hypothetical protein
MGAALGLGLTEGDVAGSIRTSGVVSAVHSQSSADPTGNVAGFCDANGRFLPLVCILNGARVLSSIAAAWRRPDRDRRARPVCAGWCRRAHSAALPRWRANAQLADGDWHAVRACAEPMPTRRTWRGLRWKGCCAVWADGLDALRSIGVHAWEVTMVGRQPVHGRAAAGAGHPRRTGRSARSGRIRGQRSGPAGRLGAGRRTRRPRSGRRRQGRRSSPATSQQEPRCAQYGRYRSAVFGV